MADQQWYSLDNEASNASVITELYDNDKTYNSSASYDSCIKVWENQYDSFSMYMPVSGNTVAATTMIKFHDVKKNGNNANVWATFAFSTPGYLAPMPISFGFAAISRKEHWIIGQKKVLTRSSDASSGTRWLTTLKATFTYPTMSFGIIPFIAVGGHPLYQRYYPTYDNVSCGYFRCWNTTEKMYKTVWGVKDRGAFKNNGDDFAANCFNQSQTNQSGLVLCPYEFAFWEDTASYIGGWGNRGQADGGGHTVGSGIMFCGRDKYNFSTDNPPTYYDCPYVINKGVFVYDRTGKVRHADKIFVYDSDKKKRQVSHLYVYNGSGKRQQVF